MTINRSVDTRQYTAMARVYDEWMEHDKPPYDAWTAGIDKVLREAALAGSRVLEVGCGTGAITNRLQELGWDVTGVDASADMIEIARRKSSTGAQFVHMELPDPSIAELGAFDAAVACFDTVNYLAAPGQIEEVFRQIGQVLRPGGVFMFDVNTRHRLENIFGQYHSGDDFETFAYVWRNRYRHETHACHIELTFFIRQADGRYERFTESHVERWFSQEEIEAALAAGGMVQVRLNVAYTDDEPVDTTNRVTYTAMKVQQEFITKAERT